MAIMRQNPITTAGGGLTDARSTGPSTPLAPEFLADPYTIMARLPSGKAPVFLRPRRSATTSSPSHDAVAQVFGDP